MATLTTSWKSYASASFSTGPATIAFYLEAKYSSYSTVNNTTNIQTRLRSAYTKGGSTSGAGYKFTCSYANTVSGSGVWTFENEVITSGSATITHNSDGTKSITLSASAYNKYWNFTKNLSATVSLPKIDRLAEVTSGSNINDTTESLKVYFKNPANFNTRCYLNFYTSNGGTLAHQELVTPIAKYTSPYTWDLASIMDNILAGCNTQTSYYLREGIDTYNGSTKLGALSLPYSFTITNPTPVITSVTFTEQNAKAIELLGGRTADTIIQNLSQVKMRVNMDAVKKATIKKVTATHGSNTQPITPTSDLEIGYADFDINVTGDTFTASFVNSRNLTATQTITKTMIPYEQVKENSLTIKRINPTSSNVRLQLNTTYYQETFGTTANTLTVKYKIGEGTWNTIPLNDNTRTIDSENHRVSVDYTIQNAINYDDKKIVYVEVSDLLSTWNDNREVTRGIPVFEFGDTEVQVNGDLLLADTNRQNTINIGDKLYDTGWVNLTALVGNWTLLRCRRIGNMVTVEGHISSWSYGGSATNVASLPEQFRPFNKTQYIYGFEGGRRISRWYITAAGSLGVDWVADISNGALYTGATWHNFSTTYMVNDNE